MEQNLKPLWYDDVVRFLSRHAPEVQPELVNAQILANTLRWEMPLANGQKLHLLRLGHGIIEREEVFLGSVLFNDWLNKSFPLAVEQDDLGIVYPVTNDLEAAYFLLVTSADIQDIGEAYKAYLLEKLSSLFFADNDPEQGFHGDFRNMFTFLKSDFEPFPVHAVPLYLVRSLEEAVRAVFSDLLDAPYLQSNEKKGKRPTMEFRTLQATMAFFYGRTSGGTGDAQSHPTFVARLITEYGVLTLAEVRDAFNLSEQEGPAPIKQGDLKKAVQTSINDGKFDEDKVRALFHKVYQQFVQSIEEESEDQTDLMQSWLAPFLRRDGKFIDLAPNDYLASLLHRVTLGEINLGIGQMDGERCRVCGDQTAVVDEKNILLGVSVGKFHNRTVNNPKSFTRRLCPRCALYSYLITKQLGSTSVGKFPIPKLGNIIFHYGQYTTQEIALLNLRLNQLIQVIRARNTVRFQYLSNPKAEIREQWNLEKEREVLEQKIFDLAETPEDVERLREIEQQLSHFGAVEDLLNNVGAAHVLDLGLGEWRLIAFTLNRLRDEKELAQKRFARGRFAVFSLLSFLQQISRKEPETSGPYYFQSMPYLTRNQGISQLDIFYVRDHPISASLYRRRYQAISSFARGVIKGGGQGGLRDTLKLAADLEREPLETFSAVLRDSPTRLKDDLKEADYRVLKHPDAEKLLKNKELGVYDGWAYLGAYQALRELTRESK